MPLLFMDTGCELSSPAGSLSGEECSSSTSALDREGEAEQPRPRGTKRRENNRDAARKSRRKQTERADELHEELQCLEQSNSALQKEIAALKKELRLYETALERHEPRCRLKGSGSPPPRQKAGSSPPRASDSSSINTRAGFSDPKRTRPPSFPTTTGPAAADPLATSSSSPLTSHSVSLSMRPAPHSLFCEPLITRPSFVPSTAAHPPTNKVPPASSASLSSSFTEDVLLRKLDSSFPAAAAIHSHLAIQNTGLLNQRGPKDAPQFSPCSFSGTAVPPQTPAAQSASGASQATLAPSPPAPFASMQGYDQQVSPGPGSLLSLLTVPSPLSHCQTASGSFSGSFSQTAADPSKDMSLSELLEGNDWILSGFGNQ